MTQTHLDHERRRFSRILLDVSVQLLGESTWNSELIDISLKGALVDKPSQWTGQAGEHYTLEIKLDPETTIIMMAKVAHIDEHSIGFECSKIDIQSIGHLRRVVELNLGNSKLLEREFHLLGDSEAH